MPEHGDENILHSVSRSPREWSLQISHPFRSSKERNQNWIESTSLPIFISQVRLVRIRNENLGLR
jgi:hypothetical protein